MDSLNAEIVRSHLSRIQKLQDDKEYKLQELNPKIAAIVIQLQKKPHLIEKVENFLASIIVEEIKVTKVEQVMS